MHHVFGFHILPVPKTKVNSPHHFTQTGEKVNLECLEMLETPKIHRTPLLLVKETQGNSLNP